MDEVENIMLSENKPVREGQSLHGSTYMRYLKQSNSWKQRVESWLPGMGRGGKRHQFNGYKVSVLQDGKF